jgi:hypothetical protein
VDGERNHVSGPAQPDRDLGGKQIRSGELRPEALMEAYFNRIADRDSTVRAFVHFDPAQARAAAASACSGPFGAFQLASGRAGYRRYAQPIRVADLGRLAASR